MGNAAKIVSKTLKPQKLNILDSKAQALSMTSLLSFSTCIFLS